MMRAPEHVPRNASQRAAAAARDMHGYTVGSHPSGRPDRAPQLAGVHRNAIDEMVLLRAAPGGLQDTRQDRPPTAPREAARRGFGTQSAADTAATVWERNRVRAHQEPAAGGDSENHTSRILLARWHLAHARLQHAVHSRSAALQAWGMQSEQTLGAPGTPATAASTSSEVPHGLLRLESTVRLHCSIAEEMAVALGLHFGQSVGASVDRLVSKFEQRHAAMITDLRDELQALTAAGLPRDGLHTEPNLQSSEQQRQRQQHLGLLESIESTEAASVLLERSVLRPCCPGSSTHHVSSPAGAALAVANQRSNSNSMATRLLELEIEVNALRKQLARGVGV